jgi:hypothetical protein
VALTKCPDCGSAVSTQAPACPKCGRPMAPAKKSSKNIPTGWGLLMIVAATIWIVASLVKNENSDSSGSASSTSSGNGSTVQTEAAPDESRPVQTYTAEQLYAMFHKNEIKANQTIGNAVVRFTGTVASIEQGDFSKTPELDIVGKCVVPDDCQDPESWQTFRADLMGSELSAASELVKGQKITLQCNEVSMPVDVFAKGCIIMAKNSVEKSRTLTMADDSAAQRQPAASTARCYGMLFFLSRSTGAAWVVGPFSRTECEEKTKAMTKIVPSPIEGGQYNQSEYGSPAQMAGDLKYRFHCVHQDMAEMGTGPDGIQGIYMCPSP